VAGLARPGRGGLVSNGDAVTSRGTLVIDVEACKGCNLCIDACPPNVLEMTGHDVNGRGYRYPQLRPGCTGCGACAQICPDFVFQVYKYDTPVETPV
jgi:2-oxoglutarate ferredoxin oxidoreductase subunit delta